MAKRGVSHTKEMSDRACLESDFRHEASQLGLNTEVISSGPLNAKIILIGEGPGEQEIKNPLRIPFVGGAGKMIWDNLKTIGLTRDDVYTTNVVKRQISLSSKGNEKHQVHQDELERWQGMLQWELSQLPEASIIFAMGNYALEAITGQTGITKWRGSVLDHTFSDGREGKVVCTINTAYAMPGRDLRYEPIFRMDVDKLKLVKDGSFRPYVIDEIINPTFNEAMAFLNDLMRSDKPIAYDIEAINNETACHGFSNDPHRAMCVNLRDRKRNRFSLSQEADLLYKIQKLCESHRIIAQNGSFDAYWTQLKDWLVIDIWFDVLLAHHNLYPQLPHNLGFLTSQYTTHPFYKDEGKGWKEGGDLDSFWRYNCKDAAITYRVFQRLDRELREQGLDGFFFDHYMRAQPHLIDATVQGVLVDATVKEMVRGTVQEDVDASLAEFHRYVQQLTGDKEYQPNPLSPQQLAELFFDRLRLRGRGRSTDKTNRITMMKDQNTKPLAKEMLVACDRYKKEAKFLGTYANSRESDDDRFRTEYKQYGVSNAPGRLSSAALLTGEGGNMQNQPLKARAKFVADPGCVFVYFDLAQAEAQVVSFRADIPVWKQQYARAKVDGKYDSHRALASDMFGVKYELVPVKDWDADGKPTIRYVAKRCRHGLNYEMEVWKLSEVTDLPYHQALRNYTIYHKITPQLKLWWDEEKRLFRRDHQVYNGLGRRFKVIQRIDDDVLRSIVAFYPQSTIGDKITQVWYQCHEDDEWPVGYARVCIDVHDNLIAQTVPKYAKTCMKIMKKYAESPIFIQDVFKKRKHEPLSIPAELKMSVPTLWDAKTLVDWDGKKLKTPGAFLKHSKGLHRWSHMEVVHL